MPPSTLHELNIEHLSDASTYKKLAKDRTPTHHQQNPWEYSGKVWFLKEHNSPSDNTAICLHPTVLHLTKNTQDKPEDPSYRVGSNWHFWALEFVFANHPQTTSSSGKGTCRKNRGTSQQVPQLSIVRPWRTDTCTCVFWCSFPLNQYWRRGGNLNGSSIQPEIQHPPLRTLLSGSKRASAPPSGEQHLWVPCGVFQQIRGLAMGSHLSGPLAILAMDRLERNIIYDTLRPVVYSRYVGDIGTVVSSISEGSQLLETLNSQHDTIKFELELPAADGYLPLLDAALKINQDGSLSHRLHTKSASKQITLHFESHHPEATKVAIVKNERKRAKTNSKMETPLAPWPPTRR